MKALACGLIVLTLTSSLLGAEVSFKSKPAVKAEPGGVRIEFESSAATDVEVAILNDKGEIVRHLAAGGVGLETAAPPLKASSLAQSLTWDRKDDAGKPVAGAASVRVRLGMTPKPGRVIGEPGRLTGSVVGLATDEKGNLYVASGGVYSGAPVFSIKAFDREGQYVRTILPMPANLPVEQAAEYGAAREIDGRLAPGNFNPLVPYVQQGGIAAFIGNQIRDGVLWLINGDGRICRIRSDGSPIAWKSGAKTVSPAGGPMCWAVSPDSKTLYMAGWWNTRDKSGDGVVKKIDPATGKGEEFVKIEPTGNKAWVGEANGWYHYRNWGRKNGLAAVHGVAADKQGRLIVCDRIGQRISVYDAAGKLAGSTPVEFPDIVSPSAADETVYVCTRKVIDGYKAINEFRVVKLSKAIDGQVLAEITVKGSQAPSMAVDAAKAGSPAVIWLSNVARDKDPEGKTGTRLLRIEDRGKEFTITGELNDKLPAAKPIVNLWADPFTNDVYVNDGWSGLSRYDGSTGAGGPIPITAIDLAIGPDHNLYLFGQRGWNEPVYRCDTSFKPVPFSGTGKPTTSKTTINRDIYGRYGMGWSNKGLEVAADGKIYVRHMYDWSKYYVSVFGPDGLAIKGDRVAEGVLGPLDGEAGGLKVDRNGFFYVGVNEGPKGQKVRPMEGCLVKVAPTGGGLATRPAKEGIQLEQSFFEGAVTIYPHLAPRQTKGCVCKEARFDLDEFGRLYVPDVLDFCVRVYDNAGNLVGKLGCYGNADSPGKESRIAFGWPMTCGVNRAGRLYVGDVLNQRSGGVELGWAAEALVPAE